MAKLNKSVTGLSLEIAKKQLVDSDDIHLVI